MPEAGQDEEGEQGQKRRQVERHVAGRRMKLLVGDKAEVERRTQMELLAFGQGRRPRLRATGEQRRHLTLELEPGRRRGRHSSHCNWVHLSGAAGQ